MGKRECVKPDSRERPAQPCHDECTRVGDKVNWNHIFVRIDSLSDALSSGVDHSQSYPLKEGLDCECKIFIIAGLALCVVAATVLVN